MLKKLFIILFLIMLLLPAVTMNTKEDYVSEVDNRYLANFPTLDSNFISSLPSYLNDRIGGRTQLLTTYEVFNDRLFGVMEHPTYTYGKDGWVFFKMEPNQVYDQWTKDMESLIVMYKNFCEDRGVKFYFQMEPEKKSVYKQYLPDGVNYDDSWVRQLYDNLEAEGVTCVDNPEYLTELSKTELVYNKEYNAGHWNEYGAFEGMNNLFSVMHNDFPSVNPLSSDIFDISQTLQTTLPVSYYPISEEEPTYTLKDPNYSDLSEEFRDEVEINPNFPHFHYYVNNDANASELPKVLIFQGSYLNMHTQFLPKNTSENIGIHDYENFLNMDYYFNIFKPDAVIFEVAQYAFGFDWFNNNGMGLSEFTVQPALVPVNTPKEEVVNEALKDALDDGINIQVHVETGSQIDKVTFANLPYNTDNVWIIADNEIWDTEWKWEAFRVSVMRRSINQAKDTYVVWTTTEGQKYYCHVKSEDIFVWD